MNILALEPYYGGSHKAFIDGLIRHSRHNWTMLTLPPFKWKWRMRHAAIDFAEQTKRQIQEGNQFDLVFCSDMLNLAEFNGLVGASVNLLPSVVYFHENQLTYPDHHQKERDLHHPFTNFISCLAADQIWFNSHFHKNEFLEALPRFLNRMPDYKPLEQAGTLARKAHVVYPGLESLKASEIPRTGEPPHILWVARWEHDKNPELFFQALEILKAESIPFKLSVIGESFDEVPRIFAQARQTFSDQIINWGFLPSREEYISLLGQADIVVSTAIHEFYGIAILEAIQAGAYPLLPNRLSYPELLEGTKESDIGNHLFDGSLKSLMAKLRLLLAASNNEKFSLEKRRGRSSWTEKFCWENMIESVDSQLESLADGHQD